MQIKYVGPFDQVKAGEGVVDPILFIKNTPTAVPQALLDYGILENTDFVATDAEAIAYVPVPPVVKRFVKVRSDNESLEDENGTPLSVGSGGASVVDRGTWAATTAYAKGDRYTDPTGLRRDVTTAYTSGASFGSGDTTKTAVAGAAAVGAGVGPRDLGISRLEVVGHSYGAGYLLGSPNTNRATAKLAAALGASEINNAVTSAELLRPGNSQGGWVRVYQNVTRTSRQSAPDLPFSQAAVVWFGVNDLAEIPPAKRARYLAHGFRAVISTFLQSRRYENDHSSIAYGGSWSQVTGVSDYASGSTTQRTTSSGTTVTISVPADFPGGTVAVGMACGTNETGIVAATVDGQAAGSANVSDCTFQMQGQNNTFPVLLRLPGLAAGAHTVVLTLSSVSALYFDYWAVELPPSLSPLILVPGQPDVSSVGDAWYASRPYPIGDADITALNTIIAGVVAEFASPRVRYVDLSPLDFNTTPSAWNTADGLHLHEKGHGLATGLLIASATASGYTAADAALVTT